MLDQIATRVGPVLAGAVALMAIGATSVRAEVTLDVLYTTPGTFNALQQELAKRFTEANPDVKVKFRNPVASYEEAAAVDLVHVRECRWLATPLMERDVPAAVVATFSRGGRNFQQTHDANVGDESLRIWRTLS